MRNAGTIPEVVLSARSSRHERLLARPVRKATVQKATGLFRTRTTYPHTAPNVEDGREPRAGQDFFPRVRTAGIVQGAGLWR